MMIGRNRDDAVDDDFLIKHFVYNFVDCPFKGREFVSACLFITRHQALRDGMGFERIQHNPMSFLNGHLPRWMDKRSMVLSFRIQLYSVQRIEETKRMFILRNSSTPTRNTMI